MRQMQTFRYRPLSASQLCAHCGRAVDGFRQLMIAMSVGSDLSSTIERDRRPNGLTATLSFPVDA